MLVSLHSYEEALQALADSEAKRETIDKEMKLVSHVCTNSSYHEGIIIDVLM